MPATSIMPTSIDDSPENVWEDCKYDPEAAAKLLDEAGYPANADGKRDVEITLNYNGDGDHGDLMSAVQLDLEAVGIKVTQETVEWATYLQQLSDKNFSLGRLGWTADYPTMTTSCTRTSSLALTTTTRSTATRRWTPPCWPPVRSRTRRSARPLAGGSAVPSVRTCRLSRSCSTLTTTSAPERMKSFNYDAQTKPHFETAELA